MHFWHFLEMGGHILRFDDRAVEHLLEHFDSFHYAVSVFGAMMVALSLVASIAGFTLESPLASIGGFFFGIAAAAFVILAMMVIHMFAYLLGGDAIFGHLFTALVSAGVWLQIGTLLVILISGWTAMAGIAVLAWVAYSLMVVTSIVVHVYGVDRPRAAVPAILGMVAYSLFAVSGAYMLGFGSLALLAPLL